MESKKSRNAVQYSAYLFLLINHPGFIKHSRCQPQGTHLQMPAEGNLSICTYFPSQPLWALSEDSRDTSLNFPLLLVYFYPSCMNQSVTYCPTVQSLALVKLLISFDIFRKMYDLFSDLKIRFKWSHHEIPYAEWPGGWYQCMENLRNQQLAKPGLHTLMSWTPLRREVPTCCPHQACARIGQLCPGDLEIIPDGQTRN